jgi:phosphoribosylformimino-5-aminoimidazole carboxamide ribotide isomerase
MLSRRSRVRMSRQLWSMLTPPTMLRMVSGREHGTLRQEYRAAAAPCHAPAGMAYFGFLYSSTGHFAQALRGRLNDTERWSMEIWPAIDLRGGKCVRLRQGDYQQETVFADNPADVARQFAGQGARHLHIVDLEGAREGLPVNLPSVQDILATIDIECELGGGIRDEQSVSELLNFGLARLVIGTSALTDPEWFRAACRRYPRKLVLGIDARDGRAATDGWVNTTEVAAVDLARQVADEPLAAIIYTDIATDGMLTGPNVAAMAEMQAAVDVPVIASGGVATVQDVARLAAAGLAGCIIGRALYEGTLTLAEALRAAD